MNREKIKTRRKTQRKNITSNGVTMMSYLQNYDVHGIIGQYV